MENNRRFSSDLAQLTARRLVAAAIGLAIAGGGVARLGGPAVTSWIAAILLPLVLALCVFALTTATTDGWGWAVASLAALPFLAPLYVPSDAPVSSADPIAWASIAVGAAALVVAARRHRLERSGAPLESTQVTAS